MPNPGLTDSAASPVGGIEVVQDTHDSLNANVNLQVNDTDVAASNPVPIISPISITVAPTISTGIYAAGDALGGLLTFTNAVLSAGASGLITKVQVTDEDQELTPVDLVLFNQTFTATADNAPFDPSDADLANCIGYIDVAATDYSDFVDNSVAVKSSGLRMPFPVTLVGTSLFGQLKIASGTPTYTATDDVTVKITVERYGA
jgi:hypothetical protein